MGRKSLKERSALSRPGLRRKPVISVRRVRARLCRTTVLMLAGVFAAGICSADLGEVKQRGTLRVVVSSNTDPDFYTITPDARPGLLREVLEGFAKLHNIEVEARATATEQRATELLAGRCDVVAMTSNARDAPRMAFSDEVFPKRYVIVTRKPRSAVGTVEELRKETFGLSSSSNRAAVLTALGVRFTRTATDAESLSRIRAGSSTATIVSIENALAARDEDPLLQIGMFVGPPVGHVFGVRSDDPALLRAINGYIGNLRRSGAWQRLVVKYFGDDVLEILKSVRSASP
jgi:ABC-type amino acid transport substrate-binding protein